MAFSKITLNGVTQMDVTGDTVDEDNLLYGETATKANGVRTTGAVVTAAVDATLSISGDAADAKATGDGLAAIKGALPSIAHEFYTIIPNGTNYNTITTPGTYVVASAANAQTMTNCPTINAHKMFVVATVSDNRVCQFLFDAMPVNACYKRYYYGPTSTWAPWQQFAVMDDVNAIYTATKVTDTINNTYSGITLSWEDNETLKIYGTATANRRYIFLNGQNSEMYLASEFNQTLPAGTYKITTSASGNTAFNVDNFAILYTYTTFSSVNILASANSTFEFTFTAPVMIGFYDASGTNFGTSSSPTYLKFKAEKLSGIPYPAAPQTNGTYTLQCTVSNGAATFSWVSV